MTVFLRFSPSSLKNKATGFSAGCLGAINDVAAATLTASSVGRFGKCRFVFCFSPLCEALGCRLYHRKGMCRNLVDSHGQSKARSKRWLDLNVTCFILLSFVVLKLMRRCTAFLTNVACSGFQNMSLFSLSGATGFTGECLSGINAVAASTLTADVVGRFGLISFLLFCNSQASICEGYIVGRYCANITAQLTSNLQPAANAGWSSG